MFGSLRRRKVGNKRIGELPLAVVPFTFGGWEFDSNSIYHVAQMPGIFIKLIAIQRRADAVGEQPVWQNGSLAAPA